MKQSWLKGTPTSDVEARKKRIQSFKPAFNELKEILETEYAKKQSDRDYGKPGWEYRQIAVNEYNQALKDILELINLD